MKFIFRWHREDIGLFHVLGNVAMWLIGWFVWKVSDRYSWTLVNQLYRGFLPIHWEIRSKTISYQHHHPNASILLLSSRMFSANISADLWWPLLLVEALCRWIERCNRLTRRTLSSMSRQRFNHSLVDGISSGNELYAKEWAHVRERLCARLSSVRRNHWWY